MLWPLLNRILLDGSIYYILIISPQWEYSSQSCTNCKTGASPLLSLSLSAASKARPWIVCTVLFRTSFPYPLTLKFCFHLLPLRFLHQVSLTLDCRFHWEKSLMGFYSRKEMSHWELHSTTIAIKITMTALNGWIGYPLEVLRLIRFSSWFPPLRPAPFTSSLLRLPRSCTLWTPESNW